MENLIKIEANISWGLLQKKTTIKTQNIQLCNWCGNKTTHIYHTNKNVLFFRRKKKPVYF